MKIINFNFKNSLERILNENKLIDISKHCVLETKET